MQIPNYDVLIHAELNVLGILLRTVYYRLHMSSLLLSDVLQCWKLCHGMFVMGGDLREKSAIEADVEVCPLGRSEGASDLLCRPQAGSGHLEKAYQ